MTKLSVEDKKVVVVGGGTGTYVVLSGLKKLPLQLTAVISTMDSGGSTGRLRDQLGVLPPGDLRQALVALSNSEKIWRDLFTYRFDSGDLDGHNFGNIFISALEKVTGSFDEVLEHATKILGTQGKVIPITTERTELVAKLENGEEIVGQHIINELIPSRPCIKELYLHPEVDSNEAALIEIKNADFLVFGPGDLYTSIIPNLLTRGAKNAVLQSKAQKVYISNLMTKPGQTDNFGVLEHVLLLEEYLGSKLDSVLVNTAKVPEKMLKWYKQTSESQPVENNLTKERGYTIIADNFLSKVVYEQKISDRVQRSVLRHDSKKLARALYKIFSL